MPNALKYLTPEGTMALTQRRRRTNWVIFGLMAAFVVGVYLASFSHIQTESNTPGISAEPQ